jgi:hypothetical protein
VRIQGTRGSDSSTSTCALPCAGQPYGALATTAVILLAVVGKAARDATDAAAGQRITSAAGSFVGFAEDDDELVSVGDVASCEDKLGIG